MQQMTRQRFGTGTVCPKRKTVQRMIRRKIGFGWKQASTQTVKLVTVKPHAPRLGTVRMLEANTILCLIIRTVPVSGTES